MKKLIFLLMLGLAAATAHAQVKFETRSTDAVRALAEQRGKLVFIDLYAPWCPPCRMMDKQVFSREDVGRFMEERLVSTPSSPSGANCCDATAKARCPPT